MPELTYGQRKELADALKRAHESIEIACEHARICMVCWYPMPDGRTICQCDNDD
jgi:hypothetical protein